MNGFDAKEAEALMITLALRDEESLTCQSIIAILSLINTFLQDEVIPASKYKLHNTLKLNEEILTYHIFCDDCDHYFGARNKLNKEGFKCKVCVIDNNKSPDVNYFLHLVLHKQNQHKKMKKFKES